MKQRIAGMSSEEALAYQKATKLEQVDNVMANDEDDLETHFVENPFIRTREKAARKDGRVRLGESTLLAQGEDDENMQEMQDEDVYYVKESGKMVVKDAELEERKRREKKDSRKKKGYGSDSDTDSDDEVIKKGSASQLRRMLKDRKHESSSLLKRSAASKGIKKDKSPYQLAKMQQAQKSKVLNAGHIEKHSADAYRSAKGKGDVIKAGKYEPFSYVQLNPRLLNRRNRQKAVASFQKIVTFGKKEGKREEHAKKGGLSGLKMSFKK